MTISFTSSCHISPGRAYLICIFNSILDMHIQSFQDVKPFLGFRFDTAYMDGRNACHCMASVIMAALGASCIATHLDRSSARQHSRIAQPFDKRRLEHKPVDVVNRIGLYRTAPLLSLAVRTCFGGFIVVTRQLCPPMCREMHVTATLCMSLLSTVGEDRGVHVNGARSPALLAHAFIQKLTSSEFSLSS